MLPVGSDKRGFSLIELLAVFLLLGLSSAIVVPLIDRGLKEREVRKTALEIAAVARELRSKAVYESTLRRLIFNPMENSYRIFPGPKVLLSSDSKITGIQGGESLGEGLTQYLFFSNGSVLGGEIGISGEDGSPAYIIRFEPLTGKVVVQAKRP